MVNTTFRFAKIIETEFKKKQKRNSRYSLRAFARDLELSQSTVSLLMRGKTGLSKKKAQEVAVKLGFTGEDLNYFIDLVVADCAKHPSVRKEAELRLNQHNSQFNLTDLEICRTLSSWYTIASLELIEIYGKQATEQFLAKTLNVSTAKIKKSIKNLHTLKIIDGHTILTDFIALPDGSADDFIYKFHSDMLGKAMKMANKKTKNKKEINIATSVIKMRKSDYDWAIKEIRMLRRKLMAKLEDGTGHDAVFCLSTPFFRLDRDISET